MENLPAEILLDVVEQMDIDTIRSLLQANKGIGSLIKRYEKSISKARAAQFVLPPTGNVLSSSAEDRWIIEGNTFSMISELEMRNDRYEDLLQQHDWINISSPPGMAPLTAEQEEQLSHLLKRAMAHCDRIADIAANPPCYPFPVKSWGALKTARLITSTEYSDNDPYSNDRARPVQIEYIRSLSLHDVTMLFCLTNLFGWEFGMQQAATGPPLDLELTVCFEECVLRHGSWFLGAQLRKSQDFLDLILETALYDMDEWESGLSEVPGLRMTMVSHFRELTGIEGNLTLHMLKIVKTLISGNESAKSEEESEDNGEVQDEEDHKHQDQDWD
ncbi:hypothetical protein F5B20DRAFT_498326 [Whalleya microplaca]|nr:hypothetical protein F5B20DRAFT_498326 [Whalleya microplaca]